MKPIIAIVDDDISIRKSLDRLIRSAGLGVLVFASAEEFLNSAHPRKADCLILDVQLPGMSGIELQRKLVASHYEIPVIFITAYEEEGIRAQALRDGVGVLLVKPFGEQALVKAVNEALKPK